jgi:hypothetical protein
MELVNQSLARGEFTHKSLGNKWCLKQAWITLFDFPKYETGPKRFSYYLTTNGYEACLVMDRNQPVPRTPIAPMPQEFDHYVGIDPGKNFISNSFDGERFHRVSAGEYYRRSQFHNHTKWIENQRRNHPEYAGKIQNIPTLKTSSVQVLKEAIRSRMAQSRWLFQFAADKPFRKWRFKRDRFKRKTLTKLCKDTVAHLEGTVCVGIGDWSQPQGFKGKRSVPLKGMFKEFHNHADKVVLVREFNTSCVCSACEAPVKMYNVKYHAISVSKRKRKKLEQAGEPVPVPDAERLTKSHQVVRCSNNECSKCWQRDINAARNIQKLLRLDVTGQERPEVFSRQLPKPN